MKKILIFIIFIFSTFSLQATTLKDEIKNKSIGYVKLENQSFIKNEKPNVKNEVIYFFSYGCHYCYEFDKYLSFFKNKNDPNVSFIPLPISPSKAWEEYARAFYIADELGLNIDKEMFNRIHVENKKIYTKEQLQNYFVNEKNISFFNFNRAYNSMTLNLNLKNNESLADKFNITGTPSLVLIKKDGSSYKISPKLSGGLYNTMLALLYLL